MIIMRDSVYFKISVYGYSAFLLYFSVPEYRNNDNCSFFFYLLLVDKIAERRC